MSQQRAPHDRLTGSRVRLRSLEPTDIEWLRRLELNPSGLGLSWRYRGSTPDSQTYLQQLWTGVLVQFGIVRPPDDHIVGTVAAYNADLRNGTAWLAVSTDPSARAPIGTGMRAVVLFVDWLFAEYPIRKLYCDVTTTTLSQFAVVRRYAEVEAVLSNDARTANGYEDRLYLAIYADSWHRLVAPQIRRARTAGRI